MGLFNKIKAGAKNIDSKLGEGYDSYSIKNKISAEKKKLDEVYREIGEICYTHKGSFTKTVQKDLDEKFTKVDIILKDISKFEAQLEEVKTKAKEERDANNKEAE